MNTPTVPPSTPVSTVLDREIPLVGWAIRIAPWALVLVVALAVRLYGFRTYPLSAHEAALASDAVALVTGGDLTFVGWTQPLPTILAALSFFLFGPGDGTARLPSLLAGLVAIIGMARLQPVLGRPVTLASAWLLALSPTLILASTRLDGAIVLVATLILIFAVLSKRSQELQPALALGVLAAALPLAHPLGWLLALAFALAGSWRWRAHPGSLSLAATSFIATLGLTSTALLTRPQGLALFLIGSWTALWRDFLRVPAAHWTRPLLLLATDEFPMLVLAIVGTILIVRHGVSSWFALGAAVGALSLLLFGHGSLAALALQSLALSFLAGYGLSRLIGQVPWARFRQPWDTAALGASTLVALVSLSLLGRILAGPEGTVLAWIAGIVSLILLLAVTLWIALNIWRRAEAPQRTLLVLPLVALFILASRNAMLVNATTAYRPGTVLHDGDTAPGLLITIERIRRASTDLTMFQFDPRDPTGGHGLVVVLESTVAQPFAWYLRDFPQLQLATSTELPTAAQTAQVVVVPPNQQAVVAGVRPDLVWQPLPYQLTVPPTLESPWGHLFFGLIDPRDWREYISFLLYRRVAVLARPDSVLVGLSPDVAAHAGFPAVP